MANDTQDTIDDSAGQDPDTKDTLDESAGQDPDTKDTLDESAGQDPDTGDDEMTILVPVEILEGEQVPATVIEALSDLPIVLLGYHEIPDQTAPEQANEQFGEQARAELDDLAAAIEDAGGTVETRLVFTRSPKQTFERVAVDEGADAILILNPAPALEEVFVALSTNVNVDRIAAVTAAITRSGDVEVTLVNAAADETERETGEALLQSAATALSEHGIDPDRIDERIVSNDAAVKAVIDAATPDADLIVVGESRPGVRKLVFGEPSERIADGALAPVLVVRKLPILEKHDDTDDTPTDDDDTPTDDDDTPTDDTGES